VRGRKLIIAVLLAVLLCGLALPAWAAPFRDVAGHWAEQSIARMYAKGVVAGYGEEYKPNDPITKEQAVVMLIRVLGLEAEAKDQTIPVTFRNPDKVSPYARPAVALAVQRGIVTGGDLLDFQPQAQAKRFEIAVLVARALGFDGTGSGGSLPFTDSSELNERAWAVPFVHYVYQQGIMSGDTSGAFRPMAPVTRAEMAAVLTRVDEKVNKLAANSIKGEVFSVSPSARSLLVQDAGANIVTIPVAEQALLYRGGKQVSLDKIVKGDKVLVIKNSQEQAVYVEVIPAEQFSYDETVVKGTVETVQQGTPLRISVRTSSGLVSYSIGADAKISVDGKAASLKDIVPGQEVTLVLKGSSVLEVTGKNAEREVSGKITAVNRGTVVTVTVKEDTGGEISYTLSSLAKVYLDYREADPDALVAGQTVTFTALGREISRIYAASVQGSAKGILLGVEFSPRETIKVKVEVAKDQWEEQVFEVAENARIRRDRLSASLRDLVPGDAVELELKNNKVTEIYAEKVELETEGRIVAITLSYNPAITIVDEKGQEATYKIASDARIRRDRVRISVNDLKVDDYVYLTVEGQVVVDMKVEERITKSYLVGTIENINTKAEVFVISSADANDLYGQSIFVDSNTLILKFNKEIRFRDLAVGDKVVVVGSRDAGLFMAETVLIISAEK
jgi:hypothetical protein